ncbi:hypothetical protein D4Z93_04740 [Clostridium fermenticellae]|uniref:Tetratricopeptide repeat protein n=1 Tax=Clostridium fermenticellae TaxID=2068654 RepID=A0A386H2G0_9CLOT|nr:DUF6483 family protein [Clostridium fermenticellae]AYD39860.1 hypothetical protein D4Z93_04740 [Clostridium fermenticellae]
MLKRNMTLELVAKFEEYIRKILRNKEDGNLDKAITLIDDTFKEIFRLSLKFFNSFSDESLIDMIKSGGSINSDKCIMMAKLLEEEGFILELQKKENESFCILLKSLNLFLEACLNKSSDSNLKDYFSDINSIINRVKEYKLPLYIEYKLIDYYICEHKYDKADDIIFETLEFDNFSTTSIKSALKFYEDLLLKEDSDLEDGNLPRSEIANSLSDLKTKLNN